MVLFRRRICEYQEKTGTDLIQVFEQVTGKQVEMLKISGKCVRMDSYRDKHGQKVQDYVTNITETVEEGKPSIITSVQVETATHADCYFVEETVANIERVTKSAIADLYADGAYQSPENRKFAEDHGGMKFKIDKIQGGNRWELIPHEHDDGLTIREIATENTYETVKSKTNQGNHIRWRIPWKRKDESDGWRYFEDSDIEAYKLRKQIESLPPEEQHKRINVEAAMFQYCFHSEWPHRPDGISKNATF